LEAADLVVINTCAIREAAEQKVIGRQGYLGRLKAANPGLRIVLTGCAVREEERSGLARRYPAVDMFLRPDEEPELVDRLAPPSAAAPSAAAPSTTSSTKHARSPSPAIERSRCSARTSTAMATIWRPTPASGTSIPSDGRVDGSISTGDPTSPSSFARSTASGPPTGCRRSPASASSPRTRGTCPTA